MGIFTSMVVSKTPVKKGGQKKTNTNVDEFNYYTLPSNMFEEYLKIKEKLPDSSIVLIEKIPDNNSFLNTKYRIDKYNYLMKIDTSLSKIAKGDVHYHLYEQKESRKYRISMDSSWYNGFKNYNFNNTGIIERLVQIYPTHHDTIWVEKWQIKDTTKIESFKRLIRMASQRGSLTDLESPPGTHAARCKVMDSGTFLARN